MFISFALAGIEVINNLGFRVMKMGMDADGDIRVFVGDPCAVDVMRVRLDVDGLPPAAPVFRSILGNGEIGMSETKGAWFGKTEHEAVVFHFFACFCSLYDSIYECHLVTLDCFNVRVNL